MKSIFILGIIFLMSIAAPLAQAYHSDADISYGGFMLGRATQYKQQSPYTGSAVYNFRRTGSETGFSPFYAKLPENRFSSHIRLRNSLDNVILNNPDLLEVRYSRNDQRNLRGFGRTRDGESFFLLYHSPEGFTGRVRRLNIRENVFGDILRSSGVLT